MIMPCSINRLAVLIGHMHSLYLFIAYLSHRAIQNAVFTLSSLSPTCHKGPFRIVFTIYLQPTCYKGPFRIQSSLQPNYSLSVPKDLTKYCQHYPIQRLPVTKGHSKLLSSLDPIYSLSGTKGHSSYCLHCIYSYP